MKLLGSLLIFFGFISQNFSAKNEKLKNLIGFKKLECSVKSDLLTTEYFYPNYSCNINVFGGRFTAISMYFMYRKPLTAFYVSFSL